VASLVGFNENAGFRELLESRLLHGDLVRTYADELDVVVAALVRRGVVCIASALIDCGDCRSPYGLSATVGDSSYQRGRGCELTMHRHGQNRRCQRASNLRKLQY
jgi:hypothetical protein